MTIQNKKQSDETSNQFDDEYFSRLCQSCLKKALLEYIRRASVSELIETVQLSLKKLERAVEDANY